LCDYHLKKVIITTKSGLIGGAYVKDQLFTSHAKIPARHWGHPLSETTAKNYVNRFAPFLVEDLMAAPSRDQVKEENRADASNGSPNT